MTLRLLSLEEVKENITMEQAINAMEDTFIFQHNVYKNMGC